MVVIHEFPPKQGSGEVDERMRVRSRDDKESILVQELFHRLEHRAGPVEVLDQLSRDHELEALEPESGETLGALTVRRMRLVAARPRHIDPFLAEVDPDESLRGFRESCVKPCPLLCLCVHPTGVDESEMRDATAARELEQSVYPIDEKRARDGVNHVSAPRLTGLCRHERRVYGAKRR